MELGRIDVIMGVSLLALQQLAMPREGHLDVGLHVFVYLRNKHNTRMVFDPTYQDIDYLTLSDQVHHGGCWY